MHRSHLHRGLCQPWPRARGPASVPVRPDAQRATAGSWEKSCVPKAAPQAVSKLMPWCSHHRHLWLRRPWVLGSSGASSDSTRCPGRGCLFASTAVTSPVSVGAELPPSFQATGWRVSGREGPGVRFRAASAVISSGPSSVHPFQSQAAFTCPQLLPC